MGRTFWLGLAGLSLSAVAACLIDVDYSGTHYRCTDSPDCPPGYVCVAGYCETDSSDASVADAAPVWDTELPADADVQVDAAPPLPLGNLITFSFDNVRCGVVPNRAGNGIPGGSLSSVSVSSSEAVYGHALHFSGGALFVPKDPQLFAGSQVTIEAWVYRDDVSTEGTVFSDYVQGFVPPSTYHLAFLPNQGGTWFASNDACSAAIEVTATGTLVPAQTWTHIAVAWDGARARFYVNGALTDNLAMAGTPCLAPSRGFSVGRRTGGGEFFDGYIDELKVSDYRKSRQEILDSMAFDTTTLVDRCGDMIADDGEACDIASACCAASTCELAANGTTCGAGTCQDGACAASGGRVTDGLVALYEFDETSGTAILDTSGVEPALDLAIADELAVSRTAGVLSIDSPTMIASPGAATKILDACQLTDELTVEAWVAPANTTQGGPARLVTMSVDTSFRNFQLGQEQDTYEGRLRSDLSDENGRPFIVSRAGDATASLQHLVMTRSSDGRRTLYVDGVPRSTDLVRGTLADWDASYPLKLADELGTGTRAWLGAYHLVAIYNRALSAEEVGRNFTAGAD